METPSLKELHEVLDTLNTEDIHQLQSYGIIAAGRNGLRHDSRIIFVLGIISLALAIVNPIHIIARSIIGIVAIATIVWSTKSYLHPTISGMRVMVITLGVSIVANGIGGLLSLLAASQLQLVYAIIWFVLAGIQFRWGRNLWNGYQVAQSTQSQTANSQELVDFYETLTHTLRISEPQPNRSIVHFGTGQNSLQMMLHPRFAVILHPNGMLRLLPPNAIAMRPSEESIPTQLNFNAELLLNQRVLQGTVSQLSFLTFQNWRESVS